MEIGNDLLFRLIKFDRILFFIAISGGRVSCFFVMDVNKVSFVVSW